jgi:hypothetical protein
MSFKGLGCKVKLQYLETLNTHMNIMSVGMKAMSIGMKAILCLSLLYYHLYNMDISIYNQRCKLLSDYIYCISTIDILLKHNCDYYREFFIIVRRYLGDDFFGMKVMLCSSLLYYHIYKRCKLPSDYIYCISTIDILL